MRLDGGCWLALTWQRRHGKVEADDLCEGGKDGYGKDERNAAP